MEGVTQGIDGHLWLRLRRDPLKRTWWTTQPVRAAKSRGEVLARKRFAQLLRGGKRPSEAVWLACRADLGPPEDVTEDEWAAFWSYDRCAFIAAGWLRDAEVQRELEGGGRAAKGLAAALSTSALVGLASIGHDERVDPAVRARCLKALVEIGASVPDGEQPQDVATLRAMARRRAQEVMEGRVAVAGTPESARLAAAESNETELDRPEGHRDDSRAILPVPGGNAAIAPEARDVTPPEDPLEEGLSQAVERVPPWELCTTCGPARPAHRRYTGACALLGKGRREQAQAQGGPDHEVSSRSGNPPPSSPIPSTEGGVNSPCTPHPEPLPGIIPLETLLAGLEPAPKGEELEKLIATVVERKPK